MVELPQRFDLPKLYALVPVGVFLLHFLDGHDLAGLGVGGLVYCAECPVPQCLYGLVFLHPPLTYNYMYNSPAHCPIFILFPS